MSIDTSTRVNLVDQYADVLDLNWRRRSNLLRSYAVSFSELISWDDRIQTSMTALKELGTCARAPLRQRLNEPLLAGELFVIGLYGLLLIDTELLQTTNAIAQTLPHLQAAWCAAMQWAPNSACLQETITHLPLGQQMQVLTLRRCHVADSTQQMQRLFERIDTDALNSYETMRAALTLIRVMADTKRLGVVHHFLSHPHDGVRLDAAHTLMVLGSSQVQRHDGFDVLISLVEGEDASVRESAVQCLALHLNDVQVVRNTVTAALKRVADRCTQVEKRDELARLYIRMLGWLGHVDDIAALTHQLNGPYRRTAAASLSLITGSDPVRDDWQGQPTEALQMRVESGDELIPSIHPETGMLWPDATGFEKWWARNTHCFDVNLRYFAGHPISATQLMQTLWDCPLAWRPWAAEHLQRLTQQALVPWDAPAWLQQGPKILLKEKHHVE